MTTIDTAAVTANTAKLPSADFPFRRLCFPNLLPTALPKPSPYVMATTAMDAAVQWSRQKMTSTVMVMA